VLWKSGKNSGRSTVQASDSGMVLDANDRDVIEACQRGDADAFRALFEAYKDRVLFHCLALFGATQRGYGHRAGHFSEATVAHRRLSLGSQLRFLALRLVVNSCIDDQRRGRRMTPFLDGLLDVVRAPAESVLNKLMRTETDQRVQNVVARLAPSIAS